MAVTPLPVLDRTAATFKTDTDRFFGEQLPAFSVEMNGVISSVETTAAAANASKVAAAASEAAATTKAATASTQAGTATTKAAEAAASASTAATQATNATTKATAAATSATAAATQATNATTKATEAATSAAAAAAAAASIASGPVTSVNTKTGVVVLSKGDVGLGNVDNTSDANKPVSTAQAVAIAAVLGTLPTVLPPTNVTPAASAKNITTPSFSGSAYYSLYGKTQASRQARMSLSPIFATVLWDSGEIAGVGTTVTGPSLDGLAPTSTLVYWQIRYKDVDGAWSAWSATTSFTTSVQYVPTVAGTAYGGGFYVGRMKIGADSYALIVAPKASGESAGLQVKTTNDTTAGTTSTWDGKANTAAMIAAGAAAHPAANFCKNLSIGGYTDWVLPAKDQLELLYRQLKPDATANATGVGANPSSDPVGANYTEGAPAKTAIAAFKTGGAEAFATDTHYWTSTEYSSNGDWVQVFSSGFQYDYYKNLSYRVRAVRMVKI